MPSYKYQVKDGSGKSQSGVLSSESIESAATMLRGQGRRVMNIQPASSGIDKDKLMSRLAELNAGKP
ncbi:MAG: hypothetical protein AAF937_13300, partial [Planctomycetota bacterium]